MLNRLVERLFEHYALDSEDCGNEFSQRLEAAVKSKVDERIDTAMNTHVLPKIAEMVDGICLTETNKWGEKRGENLTFIEYLTQRVDSYIREEVNHNGKTRSEDSYSWSKHSTRITYMISEHLQYSISMAMVAAMGDVNSSVRKSLEEAVKMALANISIKVNTEVKPK